MADIVVANTKKVNFLDKIIQSVIITVNISKMNKSIEEHIDKFRNEMNEETFQNHEKIFREVIYLKYQYEIIQRNMYDLKVVYTDELLEKIGSSEKIERLKVLKSLFEMEYDRLSKSKFHSKEVIKYRLLTISAELEKIKQEIKDEGKLERYNAIIKYGEELDGKIKDKSYNEEMYNTLIEKISNYTNYINENYDIAKLPNDERELIELIFEATLNEKLSSTVDKCQHEFDLLVNIAKNAYIYFGAIDKIFEKTISIYDDMLENKIIDLRDYLDFYKELYDTKIKTKVNDVRRTLETEDKYFAYCQALLEEKLLEKYIVETAIELTKNDAVKAELEEKLALEEEKEKLESETKAEEKSENVKEEVKDELAEAIAEVIKAEVPEEGMKVRRRGRQRVLVTEDETETKAKVETEPKKEVVEEAKIEKEEEVKPRRRKGLGAFGRRKVEST